MEFFTDLHRQEYLRDGFTVVKGGFSPQTCGILLKRIEGLIDGWDLESLKRSSKPFVTTDQANRSSDDWFLTSGDQIRPFFEEEGNKPTVNKIGHALHELDPVFRQLVRSKQIKSTLQKLGYESAVPIQSMYIAKSAKVGGEVTAHQDNTFLVSSPFSVCAIWIALRKATVDNGCMFFVKGSHLTTPIDRLFLRDPKDYGRTIFEPDDPPQYDVTGATAVEADVGDVVIFHGSVVHYSAPNRSNIHRPAYVMHFAEYKCGWHPRNWLQSRFFWPLYGQPFHLPIIDLSKPGTDLDRAWDIYMSEYGFALVIGHGIPDDLIIKMRSVMKDFFAKSDAFKRQFATKHYGQSGYNPIATEAVADMASKSADPLESFYLKHDAIAHPDLKEFYNVASEYKYAVNDHVLHPLLRLSARSLGLAKEDALSKLHGAHSSLKFSHYVGASPGHDKASNSSARGEDRYGAHTDWEGFTILLQDEQDDWENGMEVRLPNGEWVSVGPAIPGAFAVNAGDFLPMWTGGRWRSPVHRVRTKDYTRDRYSIPYFTGPELTTTIEPLVQDIFVGTSGEKNDFKPVVAGEWLEARRSKAKI